ncbi:MAG: ribosome small subunit-dependent GTPase A [Phycisphaera sp.]|nr:ribosome small subunit-dependent GTPase A [Phycisphaera sp.]
MTDDQLLRTGWKPYFQQQITDHGSTPIKVARVSSHHGIRVLLLGETGEFGIPVQSAEAVGGIAVGDWVVLDADTDRVLQRLERKTVLYRKAAGEEIKPQIIATNIDTLFITTSCNEDFNLSRIERYLALSLDAGIRPVVVLTKIDLSDSAEACRRDTERLHPGLIVESLDARDPDQAERLRDWCGPGESVALLGSSGVGKSTLANALGADDLETGSIRDADGKGRHTTTARSLHLLPSGGVLVDNPGVRECQLSDCERGILELFADVVRIAERCRFRNCRHEGEVGCAIGPALESGELDRRRFQNFETLHEEQARNAKTLAEREERAERLEQRRSTGRSSRTTTRGRRRGRE